MYALKCTVQGHYESLDSVTFYTLAVIHFPSNISWVCNRKLEEFHSLFNSLSQKYRHISYPPGLSTYSYLGLFFKSPIAGLNRFLEEVLNLPSIFACEEIIKFFDINLHIEPREIVNVKCVKEVASRFDVNFIHCEGNTIITSECDTGNLHRIEQYLQNFGYEGSEISKIRCFSDQLNWSISLTESVYCFEYNSPLTIMALGMDDGAIVFYRLKTEMHCESYEDFGRRELHGAAVVGIQMDYTNSKVYSCGFDSRLVITSLADISLFIEVSLNFLPAFLKLSNDSNLLFIGDSQHEIKIYDSVLLQPVKTLNVNISSYINALEITDKNVVIAGGQSGDVIIYNQKFELVQNYTVSNAVCCIKYWEAKQVVVVLDQNGVISIFGKNGEARFRWKAHEKGKALACCEGFIVSAGSDKFIKLWELDNLR